MSFSFQLIKKFKVVLSLIIAFGLILNLMISLNVKAEPINLLDETLIDDYFEYEIDYLNDGIKISKYKGRGIDDLIIPASINERDVTSIGKNAFANNSSIVSVTIPESVTEIENAAFADCYNLEEVIFENGSKLKTMWSDVFNNCAKLKSIDLPDGLEEIWGSCFEGTGITSIVVPKSLVIANSPFACSGFYNENDNVNSKLKEVIFAPGTKTILNTICSDSTVEKVVIPEGVTKIEDLAFSGCYRLKSITIPKSVQTIEGTLMWGTTIYGYPGSAAERYVKEMNGDSYGAGTGQGMGYVFVPIEDAPPEIDYTWTAKTSTLGMQWGNMNLLKAHKAINNKSFKEFSSNIAGENVIPGLSVTHVIDQAGEHVDCKDMVPQGICIADGYTIISAYCHEEVHSSVLYILKDGKYLETIVLTKDNGVPLINHVGGLAYLNGNIYIAGSNDYCVYKIALKAITSNLGKQDARKIPVSVAFKTLNDSNKKRAVSSITAYKGKLYVVSFYSKNKIPTDNSTILAYDPSNPGMTSLADEITLPTNKCQGIEFIDAKDGTYLIVSSSYGRDNPSELYSIKWNGEKNISKKMIFKSVEIPNMSEELCLSGNHLWIVFESGAKEYLSGKEPLRPLDFIISIDPQFLISDEKKNGFMQAPDGQWVVYNNGIIDTSVFGLFQNQYGWWRVENGYVNFKAQGIYQNQYGWWKTTNGKVTFNETGVFNNQFGWWRVVNSKVDFNAQGIYQNKYGWWKTTDGKVTFKENGVFQNENGWWKVNNSKVDFTFTGIASNKYGSWYIKNGKVDFSKNGKVNYKNKTYAIKSGKVV